MTAQVPNLAELITQLVQAVIEQSPAAPQPNAPDRSLPDRVLFTVEEAAKQLGIGKTVAWRLVGTGELASVQIGRLRRVSKDAIHDYAAGLITTSRKSA